jgi:hypothetical protein
MTNEQKKKFEKRLEVLRDRLHGLASIPLKKMNTHVHSILVDLEREINVEVEYLEKKIKERKEWLFNFKEGGWNSVYAITREEAIKLADEEYAEDRAIGCLIPDHKTFRVSTPKDYQNLLSLFY